VRFCFAARHAHTIRQFCSIPVPMRETDQNLLVRLVECGTYQHAHTHSRTHAHTYTHTHTQLLAGLLLHGPAGSGGARRVSAGEGGGHLQQAHTMLNPSQQPPTNLQHTFSQAAPRPPHTVSPRNQQLSPRNQQLSTLDLAQAGNGGAWFWVHARRWFCVLACGCSHVGNGFDV